MKTMKDFLRLWILGILLGLLVPGASFGQSIATVAGRAAPTGRSATLLNPGGIAVDQTGAAYIADTDNHRILKVDTGGNLSTLAGNGNPGFSGDGGSALQASLNTPVDIAVDSSGNLYIADSANHRIRKVAPSGVISTVAGNGTAGFSGDGGSAAAASLNAPRGIVLDSARNLYIADSANHRVRRVSTRGTISTVAGNGAAGFSGDEGNATSASLNAPADVALDGVGTLYIADSGNHRIRRIIGDNIFTSAGIGTPGTSADGLSALLAPLNSPRSIALDGAGNLYIADSGNHQIRKVAPNRSISTIAGIGAAGTPTDGIPATTDSLNAPGSIALDGAGNLYIADSGNHRIRRVDPSGSISTIAGDQDVGDAGPAVNAVLKTPSAVFGDTTGTIYIADTGNHRIRKVAPSDTISTIAGNGNAGFSGDGGSATTASLNSPTGVFADTTGNLYIADRANHRIRKVTPSGMISTIAGNGNAGFSGDGGSATAASLNSPAGVFIDTTGNLYIADSANHRIRKVAPSGIISTIAGNGTTGFSGDGGSATAASLNSPAGIFVDNAGNLYIADRANHRVRKVAPSGIISTIAGNGTLGFFGDGGPAVSASLTLPTSVWADGSGHLYIADRFNQRIRKVLTNHTIVTVAGDGGFGFAGDDGPAASASLKNPTGVFVDTRGNIYIADSGNDRIRKVTPLQETNPAAGLAGATTVLPGGEVQIFTIGFTGDGINSLNALTLTISDLTPGTGLLQRDFSQLRLYASADTIFDDFDTQIGFLPSDSIHVDTTTTITADFPDIPPNGTERFYFVTAVMDTVVKESRGFKLGFARGGATTSLGNRGSPVLASENDKVIVDIIATRLVFTTQPAGSLSGLALATPPVVAALDSHGNIDISFVDLVTLTENSPGILENNTAAPDSGVATFTNLSYTAEEDNETFVLEADDLPDGVEGDLPSIRSNLVLANSFNDPPRLNFPSLTLEEDSSSSLPASGLVTDPDDSEFTWSFASEHIIAAFAEGVITITPEPNWSGIDTLTVVVTDPQGASATDRVAIVVNPVDDPPALSLPDTLALVEDDTLRIQLGNYVQDPDSPLGDLLWTFSAPPGLHTLFDTAMSVLAIWTDPNLNGHYDLNVQVQDSTSTTRQDTVRISIIPVNDPPSLALPAISMLRDTTLIISLRGFTQDPDDPLDDLVWEGLGDDTLSVTVDTLGTATLQPLAGWNGTRQVTFTVTDPAGDTATAVVQVTVLRLNLPPMLEALPDTSVAKGDSLVLDLLPFVTDPDDASDTLNWTIVGARQAQAAIADGRLHLKAPTGVPAYVETLSISAIDSFGLFDQGTLQVAITNLPPILLTLPDTSASKGDLLTLDLAPFATDPDDPPGALTWTVDGAQQAQVSIESGLLLFQAPSEIPGQVESLRVRIADSSGLFDQDTLQVVVANRPPSIQNLPNPIVLDPGMSRALNLDLFAQDDGPLSQLLWTVTALPDSGLVISFEPATRTATITPLEGWSGQGQILFQSTDLEGSVATDTIAVWVSITPNDYRSADFNGDGRVDFFDFFKFMDALGSIIGDPGWDLAFDLNQDERIDFVDFFILADQFGTR